MVSSDGSTFSEIGVFDSGLSKSFDLSTLGMTSASVVRIMDLLGGVGLPLGLAFDVDALEALHVDSPVLTQPTTWGRIKAERR